MTEIFLLSSEEQPLPIGFAIQRQQVVEDVQCFGGADLLSTGWVRLLPDLPGTGE